MTGDVMKLPYLPALLALLALCAFSSAQAADQYSAAEQYCQAQSSPCLKQCCPDIGGTWDESAQDCMYPQNENETLQDMLNGPCGSCAQQMMDCISTYQETPTQPTTPTAQPTSSGCCGSIIAILAITGGAAFVRLFPDR